MHLIEDMCLRQGVIKATPNRKCYTWYVFSSVQVVSGAVGVVSLMWVELVLYYITPSLHH